jgi:hypothetical protein
MPVRKLEVEVFEGHAAPHPLPGSNLALYFAPRRLHWNAVAGNGLPYPARTDGFALVCCPENRDDEPF